jgi:hypothetical protein
LVQQHDWAFVHEVDFRPVLESMRSAPDQLKYIGFYSRQAMKREYRPNVPLALPRVMEGLHLAPLYFWYDRPHLARADHYRTFVFERRRFQGGDFIEDTMGHVMLKELREIGAEKHADYGTWTLVCDHNQNSPTLRHVNGRKFFATKFLRSKKPRRRPAC